MKTTRLMFPVLLGCLVLSVAACDESYPESEQTVEVVSPQPVESRDLRLISITTEEYYLDKKEAEVTPRLEAVVNFGEYNVFSMKTSYTNGRLVGADVTYDASGPGLSNDLRVKLFQSGEYYLDKRSAEVQSLLDEFLASGRLDGFKVLKVNTVRQKGYLLAAEVWYLLPQLEGDPPTS